MKRLMVAFVAALMVVIPSACVRMKAPLANPTGSARGASLWQQPTVPTADLYYGPWGSSRAPDPSATYEFVGLKHTGVNPGMTVRDPQGREWSVKQKAAGGLDDEGGVEVTVSRLLSAVGYHQPASYYLPAFWLKDDWGTRAELGGRFRLKDDRLKEVGAWSWQENPFVGTRPYQGLLVLLMMVNSTDLKNSNNTLYEHRNGDLVEQWYVVRDVGAALGDLDRFAPRKGDADAFARDPFILGARNGHVDFAYKGWYTKLVRDRVTPRDVAWMSDLLAQLSDRQWHDAFRAGGFEREETERFIRTLRGRIDEGKRVAVRAN